MNTMFSRIIFFAFFLSPLFLTAQLNHFIYLQTEGKQPFYAKLDKKVMSSSAAGYLIIPKLTDGTYNISIGFAKNEDPEQNYVCTIDNKDAGYLVKNFGDKGWGLFNLQTLEVVMAGSQKQPDIAKTEKTDAFSAMLSDVVNDPTIKQAEKPVETKPAETKKVMEEKLSVPDVVPAPVQSTEAKEPVKSSTTNRSIITRKESNTDGEGTIAVYIDKTGDLQDTIRIFIPAEKNVSLTSEPVVVKEAVKEEVPKQQVQPDVSNTTVIENAPAIVKDDTIAKMQAVSPETVSTNTTDKKEDDKKFLPIEMPKRDTIVAENPVAGFANADSKASEKSAVSEIKVPMINSDCKNVATDEDFLKLRKKMAGVDDEEEMVSIAGKVFKTRCFTTSQVKNLSVLFLKDAGKYKFFDLAYQYVSDSHNFDTLENQLTDTYYISRFKAMLRH